MEIHSVLNSLSFFLLEGKSGYGTDIQNVHALKGSYTRPKTKDKDKTSKKKEKRSVGTSFCDLTVITPAQDFLAGSVSR